MLETLAYLVLGYFSGDREMTPENTQVETISRKDLLQHTWRDILRDYTPELHV